MYRIKIVDEKVGAVYFRSDADVEIYVTDQELTIFPDQVDEIVDDGDRLVNVTSTVESIQIGDSELVITIS